MKIVYCIGALYKPGGAERVLANKANYLADILGHEIHILIADQKDKPLCYHFSTKIKLHDIAISQYLKKKSSIPGVSFFKMIRILNKVYQAKINQINPDVILVLERGYDDFIIPKIKTSAIKIRESHLAIQAVRIKDNSTISLKNKLINKIFTSLYNNQMNKYDAVVLLTEQDKKDRSYLKNKFVIPNAVQNPELLISNLSNKRAISVGRLDQFKNFSDQIKTWKKVIKKHPDWTLHIYGEGSERQELQQQIKESALTNHVFLEGNSKNIIERYAESSFFIFTSLAEGFGMVLVEAMQSGLPVISYDCPCGPGDIITDEIDGYLIKVHNVEKLEQRICELIENEDKRKMMGKNAAVKSRRFLPENIMPQWINLFQSLQKNKISIH